MANNSSWCSTCADRDPAVWSAKLGCDADGWAARVNLGGHDGAPHSIRRVGKDTAIHVLDKHDKLVWKGKRPTEPEALAAALRRHAQGRHALGWKRVGWRHDCSIRSRSSACRWWSLMPVTHGPPQPYSATRPMLATPKHWHSWCARAGIGKHESRAGRTCDASPGGCSGPARWHLNGPVQPVAQRAQDLRPACREPG